MNAEKTDTALNQSFEILVKSRPVLLCSASNETMRLAHLAAKEKTHFARGGVFSDLTELMCSGKFDITHSVSELVACLLACLLGRLVASSSRFLSLPLRWYIRERCQANALYANDYNQTVDREKHHHAP